MGRKDNLHEQADALFEFRWREGKTDSVVVVRVALALVLAIVMGSKASDTSHVVSRDNANANEEEDPIPCCWRPPP